jgi:hypothetical protein
MGLPTPATVQKLQAALHAKSVSSLLREPDAANPHVRFDEREVETEQGRDTEAPATERAGKPLCWTYTTAPLLDSTIINRRGYKETLHSLASRKGFIGLH